VKVDSLLAPFLYQHRKLYLEGIGLFTLDEGAAHVEEQIKDKTIPTGIRFSKQSDPQSWQALVDHVQAQTGKMKPLAEADLNSSLAEIIQVLNIGNPYYFEGIGTLQKIKDGSFNFIPGAAAIPTADEMSVKAADLKRSSVFTADLEASPSVSTSGARILVVLGVILTLGLVAGGGYYLYNKNTNPVETQVASIAQPLTPAAPNPDSLAKQQAKDSLPDLKENILAPVDTVQASGYKFIFETTDRKNRALKRYNQLKGATVLKEFNNQVSLETTDSVTFNIFTTINCGPADTNRVKDQLNAWYYGTKEIKVKISR
jgi:hypothetical protein